MAHPYIINPDTMAIVNPAEIFGKDAKRILRACNAAFHNWLCGGQYRDCYRSPYRPTLKEIRQNVNVSGENNLSLACKEAMDRWEANNPEEVAKENRSRKEWEHNRDKQFRVIYGIASRHGLYIEWNKNSGGDQWTIYRHHERIARICCL